ncbi:MAG: hypothetical protein GX646_13430 [Bacteroidales bacterium]|nr:hypothetical protein [Bacteroidales bacterium]
MSAIFGIIDFEGRPLQDEWIRSMQTDLAHRGPDGQGLYREESVALGHMLLQVTPESVYDKSPYEEDGFVITANARLDEREAIMDRLGITDEERNRITDPLLLLRSFRKYGKDFVKDIYGDFAFAIWDKEKKELFCARDQMGVKPFLYYYQDGRFVFSTELKAIVRIPFVITDLDNTLLREQAFNVWNKPYLTAWRNIIRIGPANTMIIRSEKLLLNKYWEPKYSRNNNIPSLTDASRQLRTLIERILADHTRGQQKIGVPLSGGLDSGTIACVTALQCAARDGEVITVSSVLDPELNPDGAVDEMRYIRAILRQHNNIKPEFVYHSQLSFHTNLHMKFSQQYSVVNANHYVDEAIFSQFKSHNVRRVLSGVLGDFTATNRFLNPYPHLLLHGRIMTLTSLLRSESKKTKTPVRTIIRRKIIHPFLPYWYTALWNKLNGRSVESVVDELELIPYLQVRKRLEREFVKLKKKIYYADLMITGNIWPVDHEPFYEEWDCESSYFDVEITYPLADRRLVEFLLGLPVEYFLADGLPRGLIRISMEGILPEEIRLRKDKITYSPGFHDIIVSDFSRFSDNIINMEARSHLESLIYIPLFKSRIFNLLDSKKRSYFAGDYWVIINTYLLLEFNMWFDNLRKG